MNKQIFLGGWINEDGLLSDFNIQKKDIEGCNFIVADYAHGDYEGSAYVLFERDGKLWVVAGSHCSCHGLEDQWEPEETSREALQHILDNGNYFGYLHSQDDLGKAVSEFLKGDQQ